MVGLIQPHFPSPRACTLFRVPQISLASSMVYFVEVPGSKHIRLIMTGYWLVGFPCVYPYLENPLS